MEFTEIKQLSSLSNCPFSQSNSEKTFVFSDPWVASSSRNDVFQEPLFHQIMKNLDKLNSEKIKIQSMEAENTLLEKSVESMERQKMKRQEKSEEQQNQIKYDRTKSIMFKTSFLSVNSLKDSGLECSFVKVFYFNSPIMKVINYNRKSTIKDLIQKSLDVYLQENFDTSKAHQPLQKFQMRLPLNQQQFTPDMDIEPIHSERLLSDNLFQTLILVEKCKKDDSFHMKRTKQESFDTSMTNMSFNTSLHEDIAQIEIIKIALMDETYFQLMKIELQKDGNIQKVFKFVKENELNAKKQFVIKQDPDSEYELTPDYEVKLILKNRLYLMTKKYMDEADDDQLLSPIRLKTIAMKELNYLPPIGINEASRYEEFAVTKISSLGIAIERILGIDQSKLYNYQKDLRQNKREVSFVDKFLGFNDQTGTKMPFRMIKDIKELKKFPGGMQIVFPQKTSTFIIKNQHMLEQIIRKLDFLMEWNKNTQNQIIQTNSNSIKKNSFFKLFK